VKQSFISIPVDEQGSQDNGRNRGDVGRSNNQETFTQRVTENIKDSPVRWRQKQRRRDRGIDHGGLTGSPLASFAESISSNLDFGDAHANE
jgi:hypothetical protein